MISRGNRRLFVVSEMLVCVLLLGVLAVVRPAAAGVLTAAVSMVGIVGGMYLGADGYIKGKMGGNHGSV